MTTDNKPNVTTEVIDLLDKLLRYDHGERLTAAEALSHAYFSAFHRVGMFQASTDMSSPQTSSASVPQPNQPTGSATPGSHPCNRSYHIDERPAGNGRPRTGLSRCGRSLAHGVALGQFTKAVAMCSLGFAGYPVQVIAIYDIAALVYVICLCLLYIYSFCWLVVRLQNRPGGKLLSGSQVSFAVGLLLIDAPIGRSHRIAYQAVRVLSSQGMPFNFRDSASLIR